LLVEAITRGKSNSFNLQHQIYVLVSSLGKFSEIKKLQKILLIPYDEQTEYEEYADKRPKWARHQAGCSMLSCSS